MHNTDKQLFSIGEASEYLGISIDTLRRWEKKGKLITLRSPGGHRYFKKEDIDNLFGRKYERSPELKPRQRYKTKDKEKEVITDSSSDNIITDNNSENKSFSEVYELKENEIKENIVTNDNIRQINITETSKEYRKIDIPKSDPIKIIKEIPYSVQNNPDSDYNSFPNRGFFPSVIPQSHPISQNINTTQALPNNQNGSILTPKTKNENTRNTSDNGKLIYIFLIIIGVFLIAGVLIYLALSPQKILSPIV